MTEPLDTLDLADGVRLEVTTDGAGLAAVPSVRDGAGFWRRATAGDGAAEALLALLASGPKTLGRFTVQSWTTRTATGERAVGVDQTNESLIVGDTAVVKWGVHLPYGPHPAPRRIAVLRDAGFRGMPEPWGLVTWRQPDGEPTLVASADEYVSGAVDGWTWAVDLVTAAARTGAHDALAEAANLLGALVADLHTALASTVSVATAADVARWRADALATLETVCGLADSEAVTLVRARRSAIATVLEDLGAHTGTPVLDGHGDLHVGQILLSAGRFVVTDFDGNPVLPAAQRALPIPPVLDVAGMAQSLAHVAIVAGKHTELDAAGLAAADRAARAGFLTAYSDHVTAGLYAPDLLQPFRMQQVLREIIYAARHLPRWMYVPDAGLPALLNERTTS